MLSDSEHTHFLQLMKWKMKIADTLLKWTLNWVVTSFIGCLSQVACRKLNNTNVFAVEDTEGEVQGQQPGQGELQLVVEEWTVWEDSLLDAGLHGTLQHTHTDTHTLHLCTDISVSILDGV